MLFCHVFSLHSSASAQYFYYIAVHVCCTYLPLHTKLISDLFSIVFFSDTSFLPTSTEPWRDFSEAILRGIGAPPQAFSRSENGGVGPPEVRKARKKKACPPGLSRQAFWSQDKSHVQRKKKSYFSLLRMRLTSPSRIVATCLSGRELIRPRM